MINEYKNNINVTMDIHEKFRNEYNLRVLTYLCGKGIQNKISWFSPENFNEPTIYNSGSDKCHIFTKNKIDSRKIILMMLIKLFVPLMIL